MNLPDSLSAEARAWLRCCRLMADAGQEAVLPVVGKEAGRVVTGRGMGGDMTVEVDRLAEDAILAVLGREAPVPHSLVSEELGIRLDEASPWTVLVDPVDGSLNAKRGMEPYCTAIAVSDGPTLSDVKYGYVRDYSKGHEYWAIRGEGFASSRQAEGPSDSRIELLIVEAGPARKHHFRFGELAMLGGDDFVRGLRVRSLGAVALSLCQVALGTADALITLVPSRSVDIAAGLLMVRESGGGAISLSEATPLETHPLDLGRRSPIVAWRKGIEPGVLIDRSRKLTTLSG